jgi:hypothetical protein
VALVALFVLAGLLGPVRLTAQSVPLPFPDPIVPVVVVAPQKPAEAKKRPDRWKMSAELGLTDQSGNRELRLFTGGLKVSHLQKEAFRLDASVQSRYGKSQGDVVSRNHYATIAFDLHPEHDWSPFLTSDVEHDPFKRLAVRTSTGLGAKYVFYHAPRGGGDASVSAALLASFRRLTEAESDTTSRNQMLARWSLRARGSTQISSGATLSHTTFFQPSWDQMADYLLRSETGLRAKVMSKVSLSVVYELDRTSLPPAGVEPENRILKTGFVIDF